MPVADPPMPVSFMATAIPSATPAATLDPAPMEIPFWLPVAPSPPRPRSVIAPDSLLTEDADVRARPVKSPLTGAPVSATSDSVPAAVDTFAASTAIVGAVTLSAAAPAKALVPTNFTDGTQPGRPAMPFIVTVKESS